MISIPTLPFVTASIAVWYVGANNDMKSATPSEYILRTEPLDQPLE